jgi:uncharacterized protein (DUF305 family)
VTDPGTRDTAVGATDSAEELEHGTEGLEGRSRGRRASRDSRDSRGSVGGRVAVVVAASVALVVVGVVAFSVGRLSTLGDPADTADGADTAVTAPADTSAEAGFARDMQVHHRQGVDLAMIARDATDDPEVRLLAYDIATTQAQQAGQLNGWINVWGLSQLGSEPSMTWMSLPADDGESGSHGGHATGAEHEPGGMMPGLATPEQIAELKTLGGVEAERRFLELMIAHHEGAIEMADAALARSDEPVLVSFANAIVASQASEIALMQQMLAERS